MISLSISDFLELIGIITSLFVSVISIRISVKTLKQNNSMIETNCRPYITIYATPISVSGINFYLILKNFGTSGTEICSFKCNRKLEKYRIDEDVLLPFENLEHTFVAPNQSIIAPIDIIKLKKDTDELIFEISYNFKNLIYTDTININLKTFLDTGLLRTPSPKNSDELTKATIKTVNALEQIIEKML